MAVNDCPLIFGADCKLERTISPGEATLAMLICPPGAESRPGWTKDPSSGTPDCTVMFPPTSEMLCPGDGLVALNGNRPGFEPKKPKAALRLERICGCIGDGIESYSVGKSEIVC